MSENFSIERIKLIRAYGAKVVITPAAAKGSGMVKKAVELSREHGYYYCNQFDNPANPEYHANTTAAEILDAFRGKSLDYFVSGYGTGGTFTGVGSVLKVARPKCKLILAEPELAPLVSKGTYSPHQIQGWTPDFIPGTLDTSLQDGVEVVSNEVSVRYSRLLASKEGIFCGISAGATFAAAVNVAKKAPVGSGILCILPDTGERYLSTELHNFSDESVL